MVVVAVLVAVFVPSSSSPSFCIAVVRPIVFVAAVAFRHAVVRRSSGSHCIVVIIVIAVAVVVAGFVAVFPPSSSSSSPFASP